MTSKLLAAENVCLRYPNMSRLALDHVSLQIEQGVTLGLVGESGSGKSSLARCLLGLEILESGHIYYGAQDIYLASKVKRMEFRRQVQMVFQDPFNSLNSRMTIRQILAEVLSVHRMVEPQQINTRIVELLKQVGLSDGIAERYPHELSGGQRQRVGIARALSLKPTLLIADEPVSALDVSIQAQILNLLKTLVEESGITLVLIAHDLAVVRYICQRVAVMKLGKIVEEGNVAEVIETPRHPYTQTLLAAVPRICI